MLNEKMVKTLFAIVTPPILIKSIAHSQLLGPSNLRSNLNENQIKLIWDIVNPEAVDQFNIYRAIFPISGGMNNLHKIDFIKIKTVSDTNYIDKIENRSYDHMFIYYITGIFNEGVESGPSNYVKVIQEGLKIEILKEKVHS